jgi:hypothetical protein
VFNGGHLVRQVVHRPLGAPGGSGSNRPLARRPSCEGSMSLIGHLQVCFVRLT